MKVRGLAEPYSGAMLPAGHVEEALDYLGCAEYGECAATAAGARRSGLLLVGVVDIEGLVGDEQEGAVPVGRGAMLHDAALREPDEAAGSVGALVRGETALEDIDAVGARVGVPRVRPARPVDQLHDLHAGVRVVDEWHGGQFDAELGDRERHPLLRIRVDS